MIIIKKKPTTQRGEKEREREKVNAHNAKLTGRAHYHKAIRLGRKKKI